MLYGINLLQVLTRERTKCSALCSFHCAAEVGARQSPGVVTMSSWDDVIHQDIDIDHLQKLFWRESANSACNLFVRKDKIRLCLLVGGIGDGEQENF